MRPQGPPDFLVPSCHSPPFICPSQVLGSLQGLPLQDLLNQSGGIPYGWAIWPWRQAKGCGVGWGLNLLCASQAQGQGNPFCRRGWGGKAPGLSLTPSCLKQPLNWSQLSAPTDKGR